MLNAECPFGNRVGAEMAVAKVSGNARMRRFWWFVLVGAVSSCAAAEVIRVTNLEYKFSVTFPAGETVCPAMSGDHPHGFFVRFGSRSSGCSSPSVDSELSAINVHAYSNATFEQTPREEVSGLCGRGNGRDEPAHRASLKALTFGDRLSAACEITRDDGSIDIYVVTQAGKWPQGSESSGPNAPYVNYTASLHTTPKQLARDLLAFRLVLKSIRIDYH